MKGPNPSLKLFYPIVLALLFFESILTPAKAELKIEYPELQVTPRASERLRLEAESEVDQRWKNQLAVQLSSALTLSSGVYLSKNLPRKIGDKTDEAQRASTVGVGVGAFWLAATTVFALTYQPYSAGFEKIKSLPNQSKRETLIRERLAEEEIRSAAKFGRWLTYLSTLTNFAASAYMITQAKAGPQIWATISALGAITPLFIHTHWQEVDCQHQEYKKKIYSPIASTGILLAQDGSIVPSVFLRAEF